MAGAGNSERPAIGGILRDLRKNKPRPAGGKGWSLSELAAAAGTSAAHLSRIERGLVYPSREILRRLALALELERPETSLLLVTAGYSVRDPEPDEAAIARAVAAAQSLAGHYRFPVALLRFGYRIYWMNRYMMRLLNTDEADFATRIRGRLAVELIFGEGRPMPAPPCWSRSGLSQAERHVRLYRLGVESGLLERDEATLKRLLAHPLFHEYWERAGVPFTEIPTPEQERLIFDHPDWGRLTFDSWFSPLGKDRRFFFLLYLPGDEATEKAMRAE